MTIQPSEAQLSSAGLLFYDNLRSIIHTGIDLLFPPRCAGCGRVDEYWCTACQNVLSNIPITIFERTISNGIQIASSGVHTGKLQSAIHALKYENMPELGTLLGQRLVAVLQQKNWSIDTIVPVPLHTSRLQQRGYNQSQILGEVIQDTLSIACEASAIVRFRETHSQVGLSQKERLTNMTDAFQANKDLVYGKTLLIVDDVLTTGSTLSACAQSALEVGANTVYGLTITTASTS